MPREFLFRHSGRLDTQPDTAFRTVHAYDSRFDGIADVQNVAYLLNVLLAELRNMDEPVHAFFELDESAERGHLRHASADDLANPVAVGDRIPRVLVSLLEAQADPLVLRVDVQDEGRDRGALFEDLRRMVDLARPGHVRHVDHSVDAVFQLDEGPVGREVADFARNARPHGIALLHRVPRIVGRLAHAESDLLLVLVDVKDDHVDLVADPQDVGRTRNALGP